MADNELINATETNANDIFVYSNLNFKGVGDVKQVKEVETSKLTVNAITQTTGNVELSPVQYNVTTGSKTTTINIGGTDTYKNEGTLNQTFSYVDDNPGGSSLVKYTQIDTKKPENEQETVVISREIKASESTDTYVNTGTKTETIANRKAYLGGATPETTNYADFYKNAGSMMSVVEGNEEHSTTTFYEHTAPSLKLQSATKGDTTSSSKLEIDNVNVNNTLSWGKIGDTSRYHVAMVWDNASKTLIFRVDE